MLKALKYSLSSFEDIWKHLGINGLLPTPTPFIVLGLPILMSTFIPDNRILVTSLKWFECNWKKTIQCISRVAFYDNRRLKNHMKRLFNLTETFAKNIFIYLFVRNVAGLAVKNRSYRLE